MAAELSLILVTPDTSPRGANVPGEADIWDFGVGAGFYLDATQPPWAGHWRMGSYVARELFDLVLEHFPVNPARVGVFGHSMGGHGALVLAQRHQERFRSVSAFAPICAPMHCPLGQKAYSGYLGPDTSAWSAYDASALMSAQPRAPFPDGILIDQGLGDNFLEDQLHPEAFEAACASVGQPLILRRHQGYDHGYYFISTFIGDHLQFHASNLAGHRRPMLTRQTT